MDCDTGKTLFQKMLLNLSTCCVCKKHVRI